MFFPTTTIKIEREMKTGESPTGEEILEWVETYNSVPADLQFNESVLKVEIAGQTPICYKKVFCGVLDILELDKITDLSDNSVYKVISVNKHRILPHMEIDVKWGVL